MAIQTIPGLTGFVYSRIASMDERAVGKLTDSNHLESFHSTEPADYDKKIISLYTQSSLYSNDFLDMINKSTPYYIDNNSDAWKWEVQVPYKFPKIIDIPASTVSLSKPGIDGQEFQVVLDTNEFSKNAINGGKYDIVILDEINIALHFKLLDVEKAIDLLKNKPEHVEVVLTGRLAPKEIIDLADLVSEIVEIKHPYQKGIGAREGIEY